MTEHERVSTPRLNEMKGKVPGAAETVHALLGCEFGRTIHHRLDDQEPCEEAAVQIVALNVGKRRVEEIRFKLCAHHRDLVLSESTPSRFDD